ncbi:MAG: hypothetical protein K2I39_03910 [Muribaculaceae bacterium]|nr:hypothetical protein [Muribaculaceae bacterium]
MNRKKFEYFLNAVHYCLWLNEKKAQRIMQKAVFSLMSFIAKCSSSYKIKLYERQTANLKKWRDYSNKSNGWSFTMAHNVFDFLFACYPGLFSFILAGVAIRIFGDFNLIVLLAFIAPGILAFIYVDRAVVKNERYLKYFKNFEKEDEQWHRKWSRFTIAFCLGAILMFVISMIAIWVVLLW